MVVYTEFQAVVLAGGKGSRMTELTAGRAKCLLPIGNKPMIWYPLKLLEKSDFTEALVVVSESAKNDVTSTLDNLGLKIKLDIVGVPDAEDLGTAESLRFIHEKIHMDFIVLSSDLIVDVDISDTLNLYRKHNASITALMLPVQKVPDDLVTPGPKSKQKPETDLIGIDNETKRLVFLASASDFEESIYLSSKLLQKHPNFTIHSKLMDAHLYVIKKWVLDFLVYNKKFSTLKGELLPYVVSKQLSKPIGQSTENKNTSIVQVNFRDDIFCFATEKSLSSKEKSLEKEKLDLDELINKMTAFNDHNTDLEEAYHGDVIRCYAHVIHGKCGLRANTIQMYNFANAKISEIWNSPIDSTSTAVASTAVVKSTQVQDCCFGDNAVIEEKTSLKESHVGPNVVIHTKTRVSQSIIMENVVIKERCVIQNCILCSGCIIEEGSQLKDCVVGAHHVVHAGSQHSRDVLTEVDRLMEI